MQNDTALVSLISGEKYVRPWAAQALPGWLHYCERTGSDLVVFLQPLDTSDRARGRKFNWQKLLAFGQPETLGYRRLCWMDADILVNPTHAPSVFADTPDDKVGAVLVGSRPTPLEYFSASGVASIEQALSLGTLGVRQALQAAGAGRDTSEADIRDGIAADYAGRGFAFPVRDMFNTGVFTLSPARHAAVFAEIYDRYEDEFLPLSDNVPVPAEIYHRGLLHPIDARFNALVVPEIARAAPWLLFAARDSAEQAFLALHAALSANHFLHFAGAPNLLNGFRPFAFGWADMPRLGGSAMALLPRNPFTMDLSTVSGGGSAALRPVLEAEPALAGVPAGRVLHLSPRRLRPLADAALSLTPGRNGFHAAETHPGTGRPLTWIDGRSARLDGAPAAAALGAEPRLLRFELQLELSWTPSPTFLASFLSLSVLLNGHPHVDRALLDPEGPWPGGPGVVRVAYRGYAWGAEGAMTIRLAGQNWSPSSRDGGEDGRALCLPIMDARLRLWGF